MRASWRLLCASMDFEEKGVVVPAQLRRRIFTIGALDNIDHNPSSTTAQGSFHGTGISLFQFPSSTNVGEKQDDICLPTPDTPKNHQLLDSFPPVPEVALKTATICVPDPFSNSTSLKGHIAEARLTESKWHTHATRLMVKDNLDQTDAVAWSAYHAAAW